MHNDAYKSGYDSFLIGLKYSDNPYLDINDKEKVYAWAEGWLDAQWHSLSKNALQVADRILERLNK